MNNNSIVYLDVKFADKDKAKGLGARWDGQAKLWYCFKGSEDSFTKWLFKGDIPERDLRVIDESKWIYPANKEIGLYADLIPSSSFCENLRSGIEVKDWDLIRKAVYRLGKYKCEICNGVGDKHPVEAHERWHFDIDNLVQVLKGVSCLCPKCHLATHFGFAQTQGKDDIAVEHMKLVNNWTDEDVNQHIVLAFDTWNFRSGLNWKLDVSWLKDCEIPLSEKSLSNIIHNGDFWTFKSFEINNEDIFDNIVDIP